MIVWHFSKNLFFILFWEKNNGSYSGCPARDAGLFVVDFRVLLVFVGRGGSTVTRTPLCVNGPLRDREATDLPTEC